MSSDQGNLPNEPQPDATPSKEDLEARKLRIELENYKRRLELEDKKLESDARDWYYRIASAVATAAIGVSTFFLGQYFQSRGDAAKRELEVLEDQNTKFSQVLAVLGSSDPSQRAAAANALAPYINVPHADTKSTEAQRQATRERETIAVEALADRLITDPDIRNKEEYSRVLADAAPELRNSVLTEIARVNRLSAFRLARAIGNYAAARIALKDSNRDATCEDYAPQLKAQLNNVRGIVSRIEMPFESVYVEGAPVQAYLRPDSILSNSNITEYYKFQCNDTLRTRLESAHLRAVKLGRDSETTGPLLTDSNDALSAAARNLSASTLTLLRLVRRMKGNLSKTNLQGVVIANGSLDDLDLSGADLRSALLAGNAKDFTCEGCDLRYADFRDLNLFSGGSLEGSNTTGLQLPEK